MTPACLDWVCGSFLQMGPLERLVTSTRDFREAQVALRNSYELGALRNFYGLVAPRGAHSISR